MQSSSSFLGRITSPRLHSYAHRERNHPPTPQEQVFSLLPKHNLYRSTGSILLDWIYPYVVHFVGQKNLAKRRCSDKRIGWIIRKHFSYAALRNAVSTRVKAATGEYKVYALTKASLLPIPRHIKVRQKANPFDPAYKAYFKQRRRGHAVTALDWQKILHLRAA